MDSNIKIVPNEDYEVLKRYLSAPSGGVVLVPQSVLDTLPQKSQERIKEYAEGRHFEEVEFYDFGGEPDVMVDIVLSNAHNFLSWIGDEEEEEEEEF